MATKKPRITITLEPDQHDVLQRLSALQKSPMSRIVSELLAEVTPTLEKLTLTLEAASRAHKDIRATIRRSAEEAEAELQPMAAAVLAQLDIFKDSIEAAEQERAARGASIATRADGACDGSEPPTSNTGATTPNEGANDAGVKTMLRSESASGRAK